MYGMLRRMAAEQSTKELPEADGPAIVMAALGNAMQEELPVLMEHWEKLKKSGRAGEPVYLEEVLGPDSRFEFPPGSVTSFRKGLEPRKSEDRDGAGRR